MHIEYLIDDTVYGPTQTMTEQNMADALKFNLLKPESSILDTPIGAALKEHFMLYGDIFKSPSNTEVA
jgi:hypothetical protein